MTASLRNAVLISVPLGIALATGLAWSHFADSKAASPTTAVGTVQAWTKVSVDLPASQMLFPPGDGADIANAQCLICHSAGMVLRQPALTGDQWADEINRMRNAFGAPLPADQVQALARYLRAINGRRASGNPSAVDGQGS